MRIARKLILMALAASAVMAFNVTAASAISVVTESTGVACSTPVETAAGVITGGCPARATATDLELGGPFGVMIECDVTGEGRAGGAGVGVGTFTLNSCEESLVHACAAPEQHSSGSITGGSGASYGHITNVCVDVEQPLNLGAIHCNGVAGTVNELAGHNYSLVFTHTNKCPNNNAYSLQGTVTANVDAAHPRIEVRD